MVLQERPPKEQGAGPPTAAKHPVENPVWNGPAGDSI
jgi:hypothetical protein